MTSGAWIISPSAVTTPATPPSPTTIRTTAVLGARLSAERGEIADERVREAARATCRARPADEMAEKEQIESGERAPGLPRRHIGVHRRAVEPCGRVIAPEMLRRERLGGKEGEARELQCAADTEAREQPQAASKRRERGEQCLPHRRRAGRDRAR